MSLNDDSLARLAAGMEQLRAGLSGALSSMNEPIEGSAGGGRVRVEVGGELEFSAVHIDEDLVAQGDVELLEDLVLAALKDAATRLKQRRIEQLSPALSDAIGGLFAGATGQVPKDDDDIAGGPSVAG